MSKSTAINLAAPSGGTVSPEHKRFQTLLAKIDKARARLQVWQEQLPLFAQSFKAKVEPEIELLRQQRCAWAHDLEQALLGRRWSKTETATLTQELLNTCTALLHELEGERLADIKALHDRHADVSTEEEERAEIAAMRASLEEHHGFDFGDEPIESMDDLMASAQEQMAQQHAKAQSEQSEPGDHAPPHGHHPGAAPPGRGKPKHRNSAAQKRAEEEAKEASQTVREVFRKLAAVLHPDRIEVGASDEQRAQRTALMQRANSAYAAGDLLSLLTLQLEIEQVSQAQAATMAATQVRHFNKVLAEQLRELEREIDGRQNAFEMSYGMIQMQRLDPAKLLLLVRDEQRSVESARAQLEFQRRNLRAEGPTARRFLKQLREQQRFDDAWGDALGDMFGSGTF